MVATGLLATATFELPRSGLTYGPVLLVVQVSSMHRFPQVLGIQLTRPMPCARARIDEPFLSVDPGESAVGPTSTRFAPRVSTELWDPVIAMIERSNLTELRQALATYATSVAQLQGLDAQGARAACLLLADLAEQGWAIELHGQEVWVSPRTSSTAEGESPESVKSRLRAYLRSARTRQLQDPAVRAFLGRMETPRIFKGRKLSILNLVDDGHDLAVQLEQAARLPPSERMDALKAIVHPAITVVEAGQRCEITGLDLMDVWRYFRHTWSLEYRPTPGRTLMFSIRNTARLGSPVMAIGALANATLQLKVRDDWIGWTPVGIADRLAICPDEWPRLRASFVRTLEDAKASIRCDDLLAQAGTQDEQELEARLSALASAAAERRQENLQERAAKEAVGEPSVPIKHLPLKADGSVDWRAASEVPLFVAKRARTLAEVLFALRILRSLPVDAQESLDRLREPDVVRAISIASMSAGSTRTSCAAASRRTSSRTWASWRSMRWSHGTSTRDCAPWSSAAHRSPPTTCCAGYGACSTTRSSGTWCASTRPRPSTWPT